MKVALCPRVQLKSFWPVTGGASMMMTIYVNFGIKIMERCQYARPGHASTLCTSTERVSGSKIF